MATHAYHVDPIFGIGPRPQKQESGEIGNGSRSTCKQCPNWLTSVKKGFGTVLPFEFRYRRTIQAADWGNRDQFHMSINNKPAMHSV